MADVLIGNLADADFDCIALPVGVTGAWHPASNMLHTEERMGQHSGMCFAWHSGSLPAVLLGWQLRFQARIACTTPT